jgi:type I restriction-modification system DNA methylase subunit
MSTLDVTLNKKLRKDTGAHYTPVILANYVALQIVNQLKNINFDKKNTLRILDPAVGDGELLYALIKHLYERGFKDIEVFGFDINQEAVDAAQSLIRQEFPNINFTIENRDFLEWVSISYINSLFSLKQELLFDLIIANPPYVRTQIIGAKKSQQLAENFNLSGRVDLYHAFLGGIVKILKPHGIVGIIVSNRFLTTKSGEAVRVNLLNDFNILHVWDLGDTRLFEAAVLPAILLLEKKNKERENSTPKFTSVYLSGKNNKISPQNIFKALENGSTDELKVIEGKLDTGSKHGDIWRLAHHEADNWLEKVREKTKFLFKDIGKVRVGIKTTADNVFIVADKDQFSENVPETLKPLITHHIARRYKTEEPKKYVVYTHESNNGKKVSIDLTKYPNTKKYLELHKEQLSSRSYVVDSGRNWYEIWVSHNPEAWEAPKLVFRDISEQPVFWMDFTGGVVNGDCYWLSSYDKESDILWLALAVANSKFIEEFYDHNFNNKLYSGRRRFITQYVEKFPLPDPESKISKEIIDIAKLIYQLPTLSDFEEPEKKLNELVYLAFGL